MSAALILISWLTACAWSAEPSAPEPNNEVVMRFANEANTPDGVFGPLTAGFAGQYVFDGGTEVDATYIRLHEPGTPPAHSVVDEAQGTIKGPRMHLFGQPIALAGTAWQNRMIDMYTNLGGLEVSRPDLGPLSVTVGAYAGNAIRESVRGLFAGGQVELSGALGRFDWSLSHMEGTIDHTCSTSGVGSYRKSAAGVAVRVFASHSVSLGMTLDVEDRHYSFGSLGPSSASQDALILVAGLELHLASVL